MNIGPAPAAFTRVNDEVYVAHDPIVLMGPNEVAFVKQQAAYNRRRRARLCAHRSAEDRLHEMLIAIHADSYIRPHRHVAKSESFHIVEGMVDIVFFRDDGQIARVVELGDARSGRNFFYRLSDSLFHTLLIYGEFLVVHEVTNGPFVREETVQAPFAPPDEEFEMGKAYLKSIHAALATRRPSADSDRGRR
jgi:cupin fold WbuC family metalloprotein